MISNTIDKEPPWNELDPGIRETVRALWLAGFTTTDSGDGMSKPEEYRTMGREPHVVIRVIDPRELLAETSRLERVLWRHNIGLDGTECSWDRDIGIINHVLGHHHVGDRRECIHCGADFDANTGGLLRERIARVANIEAGYNPADGVAVIIVSGVDDTILARQSRQS